ncbi:MAG: TerB family tellurite resistance protein [Parvularculaceae bacterium]
MSVWERLQSRLKEAGRRTLGAVLEALAARRARRDEAAFSIALIALSAKMAKADGMVTEAEIAAFQEFFHFPESEADKVRMIYSLAQKDVAGFDEYLSRVARIFEDEPATLEDVLDCLYYIALADGVAHPREMELLERAGRAFKLSKAALRRVRAAHLGLGDDDPYAILGVDHDASDTAVREAYRKLVRDNHPDALTGRGVPAEFVRIGEHRMAAINAAYEQVRAERG